MKIRYIILAVFTLFVTASHAQTSTTQTLAQQLSMYIFPANDQDAETQKADEAACYEWAKEQSGVDPYNMPTIEAAPVESGRDGSAIRGAARGAAAGAAIGAIGGDAGEGAAIGAVAGGVKGRRTKKANDQQQAQANQAAADAKEKELMDNFKNAFSACLTGKSYTVN